MLMQEYSDFHRGVKVSKIPLLTWNLKEDCIPFTKNKVITIEERGQGARTFKELGPESAELMYGKFDAPINPKYQKMIEHNYESHTEQQYSPEMMSEIFKRKLFPFQLDGVKFAIKKFGRFILGDEMGVGKTI